MQKINFIDLPNTTTPIDADNLNQVQTNVENDLGLLTNLNTTSKTNLVNAINEVNNSVGNLVHDSYSASTTETYSTNYVNNNFENKGTLLWINSNVGTSFSAQDITLNTDGYDLLEIIFNNQGYYKSVRVNKGANILLDGFYYGDGTTIYYSWRYANFNSDTEIHFDNSNLVQIQGSATSFENNNHCIPRYIIGYKTGLFN